MNLQESIRRILREDKTLPPSILRRIKFDDLSWKMKKNSLRMFDDEFSMDLDDVIRNGASYTAKEQVPWHDSDGNNYDDDVYLEWIDNFTNFLVNNYGTDTKEYLKKIITQDINKNDGYQYVWIKSSEINGGSGFSESLNTWGDLISKFGWWFDLDWNKIKSELDKIQQGKIIILRPEDKRNNMGYYFSIYKKKSNLQESIRRILREKLTARVRRRIPYDEMENEFFESFDSAYNLTKRKKLFLEELIYTTITMMMDGIHWRFVSTLPEDEFWYDDIHKELENHYRDRITQMYNERRGIKESILRENDYSPSGKEVIPNKIVVHKSNPMFRDKILQDGLKVKAGECYKIYVGDGTKCKPAIFATNSTNKRAWFDSTYDDDIWEINTEMIPNVRWFKDKHYDSKSKHIVTFQDIPREAISLKYEGSGSGDVKKWDKNSPNLYESIRKILREETKGYKIFNPHNPIYMEAWLNIGDEDIETYEEYGIDRIESIINEVKELEFPLRVYRGINTQDIKGKHNLINNPKYDNISWSTSRYVAEGFGNVVYTGIVESVDDINLEYTIYRRVLHKPLYENEIVMKDNRLIKNLKRLK